MREKILDYITEQFIEEGEIDYDTNLEEYIDSFSFLVVVLFLEKTFDVKINDATTADLNTVNKMAELVEKLK
jgi:acyl carrier protein